MRVGLIVPSSNTVIEPDFHRALGASHTISTARILLEDVTPEAERRMLDEDLPAAINQLRTTAPDLVVFGCTSAGALGDLSHDTGIARKIEQGAGTRAITVLQAVLKNIRSIAPKRLALFTPYLEDLTSSIAASLTEAGYPPVKAAGMGIRANLDIGSVPPAAIIHFVELQLLDIEAPDCIFLSCTNWRAIEAIEALQQKLGIPVVTSNQAAINWISCTPRHQY